MVEETTELDAQDTSEDNTDEQGTEEVSSLMMSDEEFMKQGGEAAFDMDMNHADAQEDFGDSDNSDDSNESAGADDDKTEKTDEQSTDSDDGDDDGDQGDTSGDTDSDDTDDKDDLDSADAGDVDNAEPDTKEDTQDTGSVDYKAEYQRILEPFKANGKKIQVDNIDDAITLMQMGAGFNRKMQILKPRLKIVRMLEKNSLLDEAKISELIDLSKKNPQAIAKLIKESGIDPVTIDTEKSDGYEPSDYRVTDTEFNLDQAIESIRESDTFEKTLDVMSKQWDPKSKNIIVENPEIIPIIDEHMQNGIFETVMGIMEKQKALGRLVGKPDVEAYRDIVTNLLDQGVLVDQTKQSDTDDKTESKAGKKPAAKKKKKASKDKRRAAATPRSTKKPSQEQSVNTLSMPDDEFLKKYS